MAVPAHIRRALRRSFDGNAWHGPALSDALEGVDAAMAAARPVRDAHTIAELVHHLAAWTREVTRRLGGAPPRMPVEGDWPDAGRVVDDAEWTRLRAELAAARAALLDAADAFPDDRIDDRVGEVSEAALGGAATYAQTLVGLAEHNAYHGGQIVLLRRMIDGVRRVGTAS